MLRSVALNVDVQIYLFIRLGLIKLTNGRRQFGRVKLTKVMQVLKETRVDRRERLISELCMVQSVKVRMDQANIKNTKFGRGIRLGYCVSPALLNSYSEYLTSEVLEGFRDFKIGQVLRTVPIPVAERSNARVCGQSLVGIAGLYPAGGHGCLCLVSVMSCQVEVFVTG